MTRRRFSLILSHSLSFSLSLSLVTLMVTWCYADNWFGLKTIPDPLVENTSRIVFTDPVATTNDNFILMGLEIVDGKMLKGGCNTDLFPWCEYTVPGDQGPKYPLSKRNWLSAQIAFMFENNLNALGPRCCFDDWYEEERYRKNAKDYYDYNTEVCAPPLPEEDEPYSSMGGSSTLVPVLVNKNIEDYHTNDPDTYPRPYYPFVSYLYISNPLTDEGSWMQLPDVFNDWFWQRSILRAFLILSDGVEPTGGWVYSEVDGEDVPFIDASGRLVVPGFWRCHQPSGLFDEKGLVCISLGFDTAWRWELENDDWIGNLRPWLRRILAQQHDENDEPPAPPGRTAFAQEMKDKYLAEASYVYEDAITAWNQNYSIPGYAIYYFLWDDVPEEERPTTTNDQVLERLDSTNGSFIVNRYPDYSENPPPEEPTFGQVLRTHTEDLGSYLSDEDAVAFMIAISEKFHEVAIDAVRYFDDHHLIFSENDNWESFDTFIDGGEVTHPILRSIAAARGSAEFFPDERIAGITSNLYSMIPEHIPGSEYDSYYDEFLFYDSAMRYIHETEGRIMPVLGGEFTAHADWEREFRHNWDYGGGQQRCPLGDKQLDPEGWMIYAPYPHGWDNHGNSCQEPREYHYTESGLLESWDTGSDVVHRGRGDDYNIATSMFLSPITLEVGGQDVDYNLFVGAFWYGLYDHQMDDGELDDKTENWGIIDPRMENPVENPELVTAIKARNGAFQQHVSGVEWNKHGLQHPVPAKEPCYDNEGGDCEEYHQ